MLTADQRLKLSRLLSALKRADFGNQAHVARVAALVRDSGMTTKRGDVEVQAKLARLYWDRDDLLATEGQHVQGYLEGLSARDPVTSVEDDYILAARCGLMLRGLGHHLNQHRGLGQAWGPIADAVLKANGEDADKILLG